MGFPIKSFPRYVWLQFPSAENDWLGNKNWSSAPEVRLDCNMPPLEVVCWLEARWTCPPAHLLFRMPNAPTLLELTACLSVVRVNCATEQLEEYMDPAELARELADLDARIAG